MGKNAQVCSSLMSVGVRAAAIVYVPIDMQSGTSPPPPLLVPEAVLHPVYHATLSTRHPEDSSRRNGRLTSRSSAPWRGLVGRLRGCWDARTSRRPGDPARPARACLDESLALLSRYMRGTCGRSGRLT